MTAPATTTSATAQAGAEARRRQARRIKPSRVAIYVMLILAALLWLLSHPYQGIFHDGVIYALMAAHRLNAGDYAKELFFLFGSQDDYSAFSPVYAMLVRWLGHSAGRVVVQRCKCLGIPLVVVHGGLGSVRRALAGASGSAA